MRRKVWCARFSKVAPSYDIADDSRAGSAQAVERYLVSKVGVFGIARTLTCEPRETSRSASSTYCVRRSRRASCMWR